MELVYLMANVETTGLLAVVLLYVYIYYLYREQYMGIFTTGWLLLFFRIVSSDSALNYKKSDMGFVIYVLLSIFACMLFLWGIRVMVDGKLKKWWVYGGGITSVISFVISFMNAAMVYKLLAASLYVASVYVYIGVLYTRLKEPRGNKAIKNIVGYTCITWGILSYFMPLAINIAWFSPIYFFTCGTLRLILAFGMLLLYFESTRSVLAHKESQYRLLADNAVDAIYSYRLFPETKFEYISHAIFEITGYTPEEYYSNPVLYTSLIHPDDLHLFIGHIVDNTISNNVPLEYRINQKGNRIAYIEHKYNFIRDDAGGIVREGIIRDVTSRNYTQQIETQLDRVNMVGEMAVAVAHEICNPLTTIRGYLQFSKKKLTICEERLNLMIEELDRITSIINEYLLLAQNKRVNLRNCCLNTLIVSWLPLMKAYADVSKVHIDLKLGNIPKLLLDKNEIHCLIVNLARNGVEAMPSGGELTISTKLEQKQVILSIKDQGDGIPIHVMEDLGTPFVTTKDTGTGLGLPTCYRIAERNNANIDIKTNKQGTTFFVYFTLPSNVSELTA